MAVITEYIDYDDRYLKISFKSHRVIVAGEEIRLAPIEFTLLFELIVDAGIVLEYNDLINRIWGVNQGTRSYLHDYISSLRSKIEPDPKNPKYIINIRGFGYRFDIQQ